VHLPSTAGRSTLTWRIILPVDLFWTFTDSLYLTSFKLLFIGSSGYIIYLMLNDYKPTHDPNIDTFKVQYLLGISAILALLFPHDYRLSEVRYYIVAQRKRRSPR
jgi:ER lumen protein retaining receptor